MEPSRLQSMGSVHWKSHIGSDLAPTQYLIQVKPLALNTQQCYILLLSHSVLPSLLMMLP